MIFLKNIFLPPDTMPFLAFLKSVPNFSAKETSRTELLSPVASMSLPPPA